MAAKKSDKTSDEDQADVEAELDGESEGESEVEAMSMPMAPQALDAEPSALQTMEYERGNRRSVTIPTVATLTPSTAVHATGPDFVLHVAGTGFNHDTQIVWNAVKVLTTFV